MSYDLYGWPVERPMTTDEARVEIQARAGTWKLGLGRERHVAAFAKAMERYFPGIGTPSSNVPMEFDVHRDWVFMALPWSYVAGLIDEIAPIAFDTGIALWDPQRDVVALPAPYGVGPLDTAGTAEHERMAEKAFATLLDGEPATGAGEGGAEGDASAVQSMTERIREAGFRTMSPLGFEITPDLAAEVAADPLRVPSSLQTPQKRVDLIAQLGDAASSRRQEALRMLGGWDPDPDVRAALRACLDTDDAMVVSGASYALGRQGARDDLPLLLAAVHRMSPADGGSLDAMLMPLEAALTLARRIGPEAVEEVRARVAEWRVPPGAAGRRRGMLDDEVDRLLDA